MTVSSGHFQLTPVQRRFKDLIAPSSHLARYWNWETRCLDEAGLDQAMGIFSHGEQIMATFFRNIWTGSDNRPLGLVEAAGTLDRDDLAVIIG